MTRLIHHERHGTMDTIDSLLIMTGTMGSGKTTILAEASDILAQREIPHASIDMDALGGACRAPGAHSDTIMLRNLRCVSENYAAAGLPRFLLARAIESTAQLQEILSVLPARHTVICRLTASDATLRQRVRRRETGIARRQLIERLAQLNSILDQAHLEDFAIVNEGRAVTPVALELLLKAGWISTIVP
jgi:hypothetical protein